MKRKNKLAGINNASSHRWLLRYRGLVFSVTFFLIIIASMLGFSIYSSHTTQQDNLRIITYSQIRDLTQSVTRDLFSLKLNYGEDPNSPHMDYTIKRLEHYSNILTQNISALENGLPAVSIEGGDIPISTRATKNEEQYLNNIKKEWENYNKLINNYLTTAQLFSATLTPLDLAVFQAQESSETMYQETAKVESIIAEQAQKRAGILQLIQIAGIALIIIYFLVFLFVFIRRIIQTDHAIDAARRETTEIMDTIQEGLFLIDRNYIIGEQQSNQLQHIFPVQDIAGKKFDEILEGIIPKKSIVNTRRFITQLFNRKVRENLINDLNPLRRVLVRHQHEDGTYRQNYLSFHFVRSYQGKRIRHVLVSITDITNAVELEMRLQKEREQTEIQFEMLMQLLRIEPHTLDKFMHNATEMSNRINQILRKGGRNQTALKNKVNDIFREVHSFKGEASALELEGFVDIAETMENHLKTLRNKHSLSGNDFLNTTMALDQFFALNQDIQNMRNRLINMNLNHQNSKSGHTILSQQLSHFAKQIAARNGKQVQIDIAGFDAPSLDEHILDKVKEIIIQLLRNAIVHGIEDPQTRVAQGKTATGHIHLALTQEDGIQQILVEDDGSGIRKDDIRNKLIASGHYSAKQAAQLSERELYRAIFISGLSTQNESNEDAGRGVGMDVVKDRIHQLHGKIDIRSDEGQYSRFVIRFPAAM